MASRYSKRASRYIIALLKICSSLVTTVNLTIVNSDGSSSEIEELRLVHFSVKEYLISDRAPYYFRDIAADDNIAQICLAHLLHFNRPTSINSHTLEDFPLARYAAE